MNNGKQAGHPKDHPFKSLKGDQDRKISDQEITFNPDSIPSLSVQTNPFYLKVFSGITRELKSLRDIEKITETFLFFLLKNFTIEQGTVVLLDPNAGGSLIVSRDRAEISESIFLRVRT